MWTRLILTLAAGGFFMLQAQPVAVIARAEGRATMATAEHRTAPAHGLEWLNAGTILETSPGARLVLAFANGRRYELGPGARVTITAEGPVGVSGGVRELEKLPPMPKMPVINVVSGAAAMGGMRVRPLDSVRLLFPRSRLSTLPEHTVLRFTGEDGARYKVEVTDRAGKSLYEAEAAAGAVNVPAGALRPGQFYVWSVRRVGGEVLGQTTFSTASEETIARRAEFRAAVTDADEDSLVLLAAMDAQLGLFDEAQAELRNAIPRSAHPEAVRKLLEVVEESMK